jgi:uncharacterized protein YijF (DUF1287 family)
MTMQRRAFIGRLAVTLASLRVLVLGSPTNGQRRAQAARAQLGVTLSYDPNYTRVSYPNRDVPRKTGICADAI